MKDQLHWIGLASEVGLPADQHSYQTSGAAELAFPFAAFREVLADVVHRSFPDGCSAQQCRALILTLHLADLVLARACANGLEAAWQRFFTLYREKLRHFAATMTHDQAAARELADSLYATLYGVPIEGQPPRVSKLVSYLGRGPLEAWLRAVMAQEYVTLCRKQRRLVTFSETIESPLPLPLADMSSPAVREKLSATIDTVLARLSPQEQFLLAAYYLDGRTMSAIGHMLGAHESTVCRRLERVVKNIRRLIIKELCRRGTSRAAAEELLQLDIRDLAVDVSRHLASGRNTPPVIGGV